MKNLRILEKAGRRRKNVLHQSMIRLDNVPVVGRCRKNVPERAPFPNIRKEEESFPNKRAAIRAAAAAGQEVDPEPEKKRAKKSQQMNLIYKPAGNAT